ncbi:hypothetical protein JCM8547_008974 [Rhodosporidiobolus lusitaniae]
MEHQKLIWKHHKRVCGEKTNPFFFPLFDDEEIQLAKSKANLEAKDPSGTILSMPNFFERSCAAHRALVLFDLVQRSRSASPPSSFDKVFVEYALMRFVEEHTKGKPFASGQQAAFFCFVLDTTLSKVDYRLKCFAYIHQTNQLDYTGLSA